MPDIEKHHTLAPHDMRRVILESPFAGDVEVNLEYARACIRDSLLRGEAPQASHCLYTQPGILDDTKPLERAHGINAGHAWLRAADAMVVYTDRGISKGMQAGINTATFNRIPVEYRSLYTAPTDSVRLGAESLAEINDAFHTRETNASFVGET